jgi:hypothetical protein
VPAVENNDGDGEETEAKVTKPTSKDEYPSDIFDDVVSDSGEDQVTKSPANGGRGMEMSNGTNIDRGDSSGDDNQVEDDDEYSEDDEFVTPVKRRREIPPIRVPKKGGGLMQIPRTSTPETTTDRDTQTKSLIAKEKRSVDLPVAGKIKSAHIKLTGHGENAAGVARKRGADNTGFEDRGGKQSKRGGGD